MGDGWPAELKERRVGKAEVVRDMGNRLMERDADADETTKEWEANVGVEGDSA